MLPSPGTLHCSSAAQGRLSMPSAPTICTPGACVLQIGVRTSVLRSPLPLTNTQTRHTFTSGSRAAGNRICSGAPPAGEVSVCRDGSLHSCQFLRQRKFERGALAPPAPAGLAPKEHDGVSEGCETSRAERPAHFSVLLSSPVRLMWHRGVLELLCSSCRYVVRRWHVPILGVDCSANPRHKQALTSPPPRSRGIPMHLTPYLVGKQAPRHPRWRQEHTLRARATHLHRNGVRRNG